MKASDELGNEFWVVVMESNAPWAPEANEFERKSFRPQTALGLELKKKKW